MTLDRRDRYPGPLPEPQPTRSSGGDLRSAGKTPPPTFSNKPRSTTESRYSATSLQRVSPRSPIGPRHPRRRADLHLLLLHRSRAPDSITDPTTGVAGNRTTVHPYQPWIDGRVVPGIRWLVRSRTCESYQRANSGPRRRPEPGRASREEKAIHLGSSACPPFGSHPEHRVLLAIRPRDRGISGEPYRPAARNWTRPVCRSG